ncbi:dihydrolipoyl dehydrogenase [Maricaulis sp.]|uniref:dihydrolipoyl dehydrogenase n=1 Tax=Maricaulis sp. TaxID=1486257 RepID=UPI002603DB64|nr:dihydrolipoyl dehydrogenase [Maricaulis sp.]
MAARNFDVIVIGGGPGGYVAAIRAAQLGFKTAVVEREHLGGICLNWGCIPTKALLRTAEVYHLMQHARDFGLSADKIGYDVEAIVKRSRDVSKRLTNGIGGLMKKHKITVIEGEATLEKGAEAPAVVVGKDKYTAKHVILATGARARTIPQAGLEPDGDKVWTYREAMVPKTMPKSVLVIGSGAIGIEFASFYNTMGADVTVVEMMDRVLPVEDEEISALAARSFKKQGMKLITSAQVEKLEKSARSVKVHIKDAKGKTQTVEVEKVILAVGIVGNVENLGLEALGVKIDRGHVVNDGFGRTNVKGLYAIGDVAGPPWLAHKASHEGVVCVEKISGQDVHAFETGNIPGCTYCHPQIASVGLTEAKAKEAGHEVKVGRFPFVGNGKAIALGDDQGLVKTVFDAKTGEFLGAHMVGAEVTELIQGYAIARQLETTEAELMHTVFPHPTLSEMMHESVLDAYGRVLHI